MAAITLASIRTLCSGPNPVGNVRCSESSRISILAGSLPGAGTDSIRVGIDLEAAGVAWSCMLVTLLCKPLSCLALTDHAQVSPTDAEEPVSQVPITALPKVIAAGTREVALHAPAGRVAYTCSDIRAVAARRTCRWYTETLSRGTRTDENPRGGSQDATCHGVEKLAATDWTFRDPVHEIRSLRLWTGEAARAMNCARSCGAASAEVLSTTCVSCNSRAQGT